MIYKNCGEVIPAPGSFLPEDAALLHKIYESMVVDARAQATELKFHRVLEDIWRYVYDANAYVDIQAPWALKKTDEARMATVLYVLAEATRCLAIMVQPVTPTAAGRLLDQLAVPQDKRLFAHISKAHALTPGTKIEKPEGVFPRIVESEEAA
jgi:methionyl-tRNA synthetase